MKRHSTRKRSTEKREQPVTYNIDEVNKMVLFTRHFVRWSAQVSDRVEARVADLRQTLVLGNLDVSMGDITWHTRLDESLLESQFKVMGLNDMEIWADELLAALQGPLSALLAHSKKQGDNPKTRDYRLRVNVEAALSSDCTDASGNPNICHVALVVTGASYPR